MCQYTYHHYPRCGHIAKWTVDSCIELTNKLREASPATIKASCVRTKSKHDSLPQDHPTGCLQCELDWQKQFTGKGSSKGDRSVQLTNGLMVKTKPILELQAGMTFPVDEKIKVSKLLSQGGEVKEEGNENGEPAGQYAVQEACLVGMALVPDFKDLSAEIMEESLTDSLVLLSLTMGKEESRDQEDSVEDDGGAHTSDLDISGRNLFDWQSSVDDYPAWENVDIADLARAWNHIRKDEEPPKEAPTDNSEEKLETTTNTKTHEGTFYESSSSTPYATNASSPNSPDSFTHDLPSDESPMTLVPGVYDWTRDRETSGYFQFPILEIRTDYHVFSSTDNNNTGLFAHESPCPESANTDPGYEGDSESDDEVESPPLSPSELFFFRPLTPHASDAESNFMSDSCGSLDSLSCNASDTELVYDSDMDFEDGDVVEVISRPETPVPTESEDGSRSNSNHATDNADSVSVSSGSFRLLPCNPGSESVNRSDSDLDYDDDVSVVEVIPYPETGIQTEADSRVLVPTSNNALVLKSNTDMNTTPRPNRPRLTIIIPDPISHTTTIDTSIDIDTTHMYTGSPTPTFLGSAVLGSGIRSPNPNRPRDGFCLEYEYDSSSEYSDPDSYFGDEDEEFEFEDPNPVVTWGLGILIPGIFSMILQPSFR